MYISTENVDALCVPFGIIIGPGTILLNTALSIADVAKINFNRSLNRNYKPSDAYRRFKDADLAWEKNISAKYKPHMTSEGSIRMTSSIWNDPEAFDTVLNNAHTIFFRNYAQRYNKLSAADKREIELEQSRQDFDYHTNLIGIGFIRSIPIIGGLARLVYNITK